MLKEDPPKCLCSVNRLQPCRDRLLSFPCASVLLGNASNLHTADNPEINISGKLMHHRILNDVFFQRSYQESFALQSTWNLLQAGVKIQYEILAVSSFEMSKQLHTDR